MPKSYFKISVIACATITLVSGCAVSLQPLERNDLLQTLRLDRLAAQKNVEALNSDLTIEEAIARGVKYNLDHRVRMMERSVAMGQFDLSRYDMLPKIMANAGYSTRDKPNQNTNLPDSSDQDINTSSLSLSWNLLDFGMSYYTAKQNADRALVAAEKRRKAMHILIQDIQTAFLRAASAQKLRKDILEVIKLGDEALQDALKVEQENLRKPLEVLRYQKNLLDNLRVLESINQELSSAEIELVTLLNLPTGTKIKIKEPSFDVFFKGIDQISIDDLEVLALSNNADIKESVYNSRIAVEETKKSILKILPGISFNYGQNYTSNSYTVNKNWMEGAGQINFNLFNILTAPKVFAQGDAEKELANQRRMAMQMAILGQVHLANQQLENAKRLHTRSENIARVDSRISSIAIASEKQGTLSKAELVSAQSSHIVSQLRKYQSLSQLYAASGRLQSTLGYEPDFGDIQSSSLQALTETVSRSMADWNSGNIIKNSIKEIDVVSQPSITSTSVESKNVNQTVNKVAKSDVLRGATIATVAESPNEVRTIPSAKAEVQENLISTISDVKVLENSTSESPSQVSDASRFIAEKSPAPLVDQSSTAALLDSNVESKPITVSSPQKVNLKSFKINQPASKSLSNMSWTIPTNGIDWSPSSKADHIVNGQLIWGAKSSTNRTIKIVWRINNVQEKTISIHHWQSQIPANPSTRSWEILRLDALNDLAHFLNKEASPNAFIKKEEILISAPDLKVVDAVPSKTNIGKVDPIVELPQDSVNTVLKIEENGVVTTNSEEVRVIELEAEKSGANSKSLTSNVAPIYLESFKINQPASKSLNDMSWTLPTENINWVKRSSANYRVSGQLFWGVKSPDGRDINIRWTILHIQSNIKTIHQSIEYLPKNPTAEAWLALRESALSDLSNVINSLEQASLKNSYSQEILAKVDESSIKSSKKSKKEDVIVKAEVITPSSPNVTAVDIKNGNQEGDNTNQLDLSSAEKIIKLHLRSFKVNQPASKSLSGMSWTLPIKSIKWINSKEADYQVEGKLIWGPRATGDRAIKITWVVKSSQSGKNINYDWNGFISKNPSAADWENLRFNALEGLASYLSKLE